MGMECSFVGDGVPMRTAVMPVLVAGIHALAKKKDVDGRDIGERSDAVLRTAMPGHDVERSA